jgi:hypothetical protein
MQARPEGGSSNAICPGGGASKSWDLARFMLITPSELSQLSSYVPACVRCVQGPARGREDTGLPSIVGSILEWGKQRLWGPGISQSSFSHSSLSFLERDNRSSHFTLSHIMIVCHHSGKCFCILSLIIQMEATKVIFVVISNEMIYPRYNI